MYYPNQKNIIIKNFNTITHKEKTNEAFLQPIDWKYYEEALQELSGNTFKLWLYLLKWQGKGNYEFSPAKLMKAFNIGSKNTIYAMKDELIEKNYLIETSENIWFFYPCGHADLLYQNLT